ncbi:MAG: acetyl-CoA carboxylase biotin carboxylase subunit [Myxococcaceae bacterium]
MKKILIANRGEIAVRVMRTCRDMGIQTVAVFSEPDRKALHVRYATEAYLIGPALASESYLNINKIIDTAKKSGADAIHPGYGFLSENAEFAQAVLDAGLIFIGPKPSSIHAMGSKTRARQIMQTAGVPVVPGICESISDFHQALKIAKEIGFPVMLKAAAGGGGKGMRKVETAEDLQSAFESTISEAQNSFADSAIYIEKFLENPRHIEVQIFADTQGHVISFAERECSVQRRHQKVIEESPSCFVNEEMRQKMGQVARQAALAVDYVGAGTIEFLLDAHKNFYFMEMNTRLQVEHPVTEMVTGLDLVEMQIKVARGEPLEIREQYVPAKGWAVEGRLCAEDPLQNFMPTPGNIRHFRQPGGPYVRTDAAIYTGCDVLIDYDPMIGKIIAWAPTRNLAIKRLDRALSELTIKGCTTNAMFLRQILNFEPFVSGIYDTSLINQFQKEPPKWVESEHEIVAMLGGALFNFKREKKMQTHVNTREFGDRQQLSNWQLK